MENATQHNTYSPCPDLGAQDDSSISCAYPSFQNTCFHCQKLATPNLDHQAEFCLTQSYTKCPVYLAPGEKEFPAHLRHVPESTPRNMSQALLIGGLTLAFGLILWLGWKPLGQLMTPPTSPINLALTTRPTKTPEPSATASLPPNTRRPRPTVTSTITTTPTPTNTLVPITRGLDLPFNVGDNRFLIHRVLAGETLEGLARKYTTTQDAIREINIFLPTPLWADVVILISPGMQLVDPALPAFEPYKVPDADIALADLAVRLKVDPELLRYYTVCADPCRFDDDDWLIIPRLR